MAIGLSAYAFSWRRAVMTLADIFDSARGLGIHLVQLCDVPELEAADAAGLARVRDEAESREITLQTGTKGVESDHLARHLDIATALDARLVRSMLSSPRGVPTVDEAIGSIREVLPDYIAAGVTLGLETYEQFSTEELLTVVRTIDDPHLGVVLDPGNSVARLENPADVIARTAPYVVNLHVKDYAFTRRQDMIGFTFAGALLGEGLLDYDGICDALERSGRRVDHIVEHWLTRRQTPELTRETEAAWIDASVSYLRERERS